MQVEPTSYYESPFRLKAPIFRPEDKTIQRHLFKVHLPVCLNASSVNLVFPTSNVCHSSCLILSLMYMTCKFSSIHSWCTNSPTNTAQCCVGSGYLPILFVMRFPMPEFPKPSMPGTGCQPIATVRNSLSTRASPAGITLGWWPSPTACCIAVLLFTTLFAISSLLFSTPFVISSLPLSTPLDHSSCLQSQ